MISNIDHERIKYEEMFYPIFFLIATFLVNITYQSLKDAHQTIHKQTITLCYLTLSIILIFLGMSLLFAKMYTRMKKILYTILMKRPYSALPATFLDTTILLSILLIVVNINIILWRVVYLAYIPLIVLCFTLMLVKIEGRPISRNRLTRFSTIIAIIAMIIIMVVLTTIIYYNICMKLMLLTASIFMARFLPEILVNV